MDLGKIVQIIQAVWMVIRFLFYLLSLFKQPKAAQTIMKKASQEVKAVKLAADPRTSVTPTEVQETLDDHMDEINEIIDSADFQRIKRGE